MQIPADILDQDRAIDLCISMGRQVRPFTWQAAMMLRRHSTLEVFQAEIRKALGTFDPDASSFCILSRYVHIKAATARFPMAGQPHATFELRTHV